MNIKLPIEFVSVTHEISDVVVTNNVSSKIEVQTLSTYHTRVRVEATQPDGTVFVCYDAIFKRETFDLLRKLINAISSNPNKFVKENPENIGMVGATGETFVLNKKLPSILQGLDSDKQRELISYLVACEDKTTR